MAKATWAGAAEASDGLKPKGKIKRFSVVAFPLPKLLPRIEELLHEVQWLDGLILVTDSERASFVSFSNLLL